VIGEANPKEILKQLEEIDHAEHQFRAILGTSAV